MATIGSYPNDDTVSVNDKVLATDSLTGKTKNIELSSIVNLINAVAGKDYIQYQFSLIDFATVGSFTSKDSKTNPEEVTQLFLNKQSLKKDDLTALISRFESLQDVVITLKNQADTNNFVVFKIIEITNNTDYFIFDVVLYKNFYSGTLSPGETYSAYFDIKENFVDKTDKGNFTGTSEDLNTDIQTRVLKVEGKSLVLDSEIAKLVNLDNTKDVDKPISTAQTTAIAAAEARLNAEIISKITNSTIINGVTLNSAIPATGNIHTIVSKNGTYVNWNNIVVPTNTLAVLTRVDGVYASSQTTIELPKGIVPFVDGAWVINSQVNFLGKDWTNTVATVAGEIPGTSSKWVERLSGYNLSGTVSKLELYIIGKNKFNKAKVTTGFYVNNTTGQLQGNSIYSVSEYIPILPNTNYFQSGNGNSLVAFYDVNNIYISGSSTAAITTPSNAALLRMNTLNTNIDTAQLELGSVSTAYSVFQYYVNVPLKDSSITADKFEANALSPTLLKAESTSKYLDDTYFTSFNKFDKLKALDGFAIGANGTVSANAAYSLSDYIRIEPNKFYTLSNSGAYVFIAWYTMEKVYISTFNGGSVVTSQAPENAYYLRVNCLVDKKNVFQVEEGSVATNYQRFAFKLLPIIRDANVFTELKWNALGDSHTFGAGYKELVKDYLKIGTLNNYGVSGTELVIDNYFGSSMLNRIDSMDSDADIITVFGGTNDFKNNNLVIGTISDSISTVSLYGGMRAICEKLLTRYPAKIILIISPPQMGGSYVTAQGLNSLGNHMVQYRNVMRELSELYAIPFIDLTTQSGITQKNITSYSGDNLHPNTLGSKKISSLIIDSFNKLIKY